MHMLSVRVKNAYAISPQARRDIYDKPSLLMTPFIPSNLLRNTKHILQQKRLAINRVVTSSLLQFILNLDYTFNNK